MEQLLQTDVNTCVRGKYGPQLEAEYRKEINQAANEIAKKYQKKAWTLYEQERQQNQTVEGETGEPMEPVNEITDDDAKRLMDAAINVFHAFNPTHQVTFTNGEKLNIDDVAHVEYDFGWLEYHSISPEGAATYRLNNDNINYIVIDGSYRS